MNEVEKNVRDTRDAAFFGYGMSFGGSLAGGVLLVFAPLVGLMFLLGAAIMLGITVWTCT